MKSFKFSIDFYILVFVRFCFAFSVQLQATLMGWQMYEMTHDPLKLGLIGLAEGIPALSLTLFAGYLVDRGNPKNIYFSVILVSLTSLMISMQATSPHHLYIAAILTGLVRSFGAPASQTMVPRLVGLQHLKESSAWTTMAQKCGSIIGPAVGGIILAMGGVKLPYVLAFSLLFSAALLFLFKVKIPHYKNETLKIDSHKAEVPQFFEELFEGIRFVFKSKIILASLGLDMFAVLFGGVTSILPMFAKDVLHLGADGLGVLRAASGIGALLMSVFLIKFPFIKKEGKTLFWVVIGFGLCNLLFCISRNLFLCSLFLAAAGAFDSISMVIRNTLVQTFSPENMRGRIAAVNSIFIGSSNEIGAFESGFAARFLGLMPSLYFGACMTFLTVLAVYKMTPGFYKFELKPDKDPS